MLGYILAFFAWWTYSLISLSAEKHALILVKEEHRARLACLTMRTALKDTQTGDFNTQTVNQYAQTNCKDLVLVWTASGIPQLTVNQEIKNTNNYQLLAEKRKYLLEGVSMFLIIAIGVIWIFGKVGKILNLSKQQNNFLLSVSHELKTPITAIQLSGQTLSANFQRLSEDMKLNLLGKIDTNTKRLDNLIDQMLMITRIEGAQYQYHNEEIDLKQMCAGIIANSSLKHRSANDSPINVINKIADNLKITFDRLTLEICFSNLIENAIKYSPNGGLITLLSAEKAGYVQIEIADQGIGIPENEKNRIFEKFYRVGNEETRTAKGTGLGLYLVFQVLKKNNGSIKVKDNEPYGSVFMLKLKK